MTAYLGLFVLVKSRRKVDLFLSYLQEHLVSLHRRGSWRMTHLKEDDANAVDVNFLSKKKREVMYTKNKMKMGDMKKKKVSRGWFRSIDLWVMGPARSHCATLLPWVSVWFMSHFIRIGTFLI